MFFMMFLVWLLSDWFSVVSQQHVINHDDPIYRRKDNFVDAEAFEELVGFVLQHPFVGNWTWAQKTAAVGSMMHPWGQCNVDGFQQLCLKSDVRFLCEPLLKRVKEHNSNAFVLKLYMGYASDYAAAPSFFYSTLPLQGTGGPGIDDPKNRWAPKTVSIFDVQVPAGMQGGQLQVFEDTNDRERDTSYANRAGPARMEPPAANTLHTLRGDTYYTFTDYNIAGVVAGEWQEMPAEFRRMSIVFEQYIISNSSYPGTYEYDLWQIDRERVESVYAFGTVLWMVVGGVVGFVSQHMHLDQGNVVRPALGALIGCVGGGAIGCAFAFAGLHLMKSVQTFLKGTSDLIYEGYYVHSPEVTIWFLVSSFGAVVGTLFVWLFQDAIISWRKSKSVSDISQSFADLAVGEGLTAPDADLAASKSKKAQ
jgi:hypothetical protein